MSSRLYGNWHAAVVTKRPLVDGWFGDYTEQCIWGILHSMNGESLLTNQIWEYV